MILALNAHPLPAPLDAITIAQCWLGDDRDIPLAAAWSVLSDTETARARRFHFDRDRHRYVRGRAFLRILLAQVTGLADADLVLSEGPWGKPFLQGDAVWFNLSHSGDLAVLALSPAGQVGIDVEFVDRAVDISGLAQSCFCPHEVAILDAVPPAARLARFFALWTAKEARMKLTGEGMALTPQSIELELVAGLPVGYTCPKSPAARAIFVDLGHPGAICCLAWAPEPDIISTFLKNPLHHVAA